MSERELSRLELSLDPAKLIPPCFGSYSTLRRKKISAELRLKVSTRCLPSFQQLHSTRRASSWEGSPKAPLIARAGSRKGCEDLQAVFPMSRNVNQNVAFQGLAACPSQNVHDGMFALDFRRSYVWCGTPTHLLQFLRPSYYELSPNLGS